MRVALFEPEAAGHHMALHVRYIVREMARRGWDVDLVTTDRALKHPAYKIVEEESGSAYRVSTMPDRETPAVAKDLQRVRDQFTRWKNYRAGFESLSKKPEAIYLVNLDQMDLALAKNGAPFGETPFAGMMIGRHFHCPAMGIKMASFKLRDKAMGPVFQRLLKISALKKVAVLDEALQKFVEKEKWNGWEKVAYVPDVASLAKTNTTLSMRQNLGIPVTAFVVLAYGALSERKGVVELLQGLADPHTPSEAVALFAGRQDEFTKQFLQAGAARSLREKGRLFELDAFLDDTQEEAAFAAADAVWLGYRGWYGMSGVLVQAAAAGKPLLAMDQGLIGWLAHKHELGVSVDMFEPNSVASGIRKLFLDVELRKRYASNGLKLAENHTPELFGKRICDLIEQTAGHVPSPTEAVEV